MKLVDLALLAFLAGAATHAADLHPDEAEASITKTLDVAARHGIYEDMKELFRHEFAQALREDEILRIEAGEYFIDKILSKVKDGLIKAETKIKKAEKAAKDAKKKAFDKVSKVFGRIVGK